MKPNRLILNELAETLQLWEDVSLVAVQQNKAAKIKNELLHSALRVVGDFSSFCGLENYDRFRTALQNKVSLGPEDFLPRVPEEAQDWLDKINFLRGNHLNNEALSFFPHMMAEWMKSKKVFRIEDHSLIPMISLQERNYLDLLPCDSFMISFSNPIEIGFETSPLIHRYKSCIIARSGDLIDTFWIPVEVERKSLKPHGRKLIKRIVQGNRFNEKQLSAFFTYAKENNLFANPAPFVNAAFDIEKGYLFSYKVKKPDLAEPEIAYNDVYTGTLFTRKSDGSISEPHDLNDDTDLAGKARLKDSFDFHRFFLELLNGFCYMMSEIKRRKTDPEHGKDVHTQQLTREFGWNEIPITKVDYLEEDLRVLGPIKVSYGSGEKSPHIRVGHWRNIIKKDGSSDRIWIEQVMVRKDKLGSEELKGSATVVREKRKI